MKKAFTLIELLVVVAIIGIPVGDDKDKTRPKTMIDDTYKIFKNLGLKEL